MFKQKPFPFSLLDSPKAVFPEGYHPFSSNPHEQARKPSQEEKDKFLQSIITALDTIEKDGGKSLTIQLTGSDMDFFEYGINRRTDLLIEDINNELKGAKIVGLHIYPIGRITRANTDFPSEPGKLIFEFGLQ